jgi:putative DNA primase/helicase
MSARRTKKPKAPYHDHYDLIFRGYGEDDKIKRKNNAPLKEFDEVSGSRDLVGVFKENIVMIDVDDKHSADIIFKILNDLGVSFLYQETTRGKHFFFEHGKYNKILRDRNGVLAAVGLHVDYKCHNVDCTQLVKDAEPRPVHKSENFNELEELPYYLMPTTADEEFLGLKQGGGRNETCYIYILTLLRYGLSKEEVRNTITLINNYVLGDPFSDRELKTILRDEAFPTMNEVFIYKQPGKKTPSLDYELFSKYLIEKYHIIKIDKKLYVYENGVYVMLEQDNLNTLVMTELKNTTKNMRSELKDYITNYTEPAEQTNYNYILFKNCIYDIRNKTTLPITPDRIFLNDIAHNYKPDAEPVELIDTVLNNLACGDEEVRRLLLEIIGYTFYRRNKLRKFFMIVGSGSNGKSTFLDMIKHLIGESNTATASLQEIVTDKFIPWLLTNKLLNVGDDIDKEFVTNTGTFKKLVTGETIIAQKKGQDQYPMSYYGKFIFSCNEIPRINDKTDGLKTRMVIVPLNAKFDKSNNNYMPFVDEQLQDQAAMEYLLKLSLDALIEVLHRGSFTLPQQVIDATEEYHIENDTILQYLREFDIDNKYINDVYLSYSSWCHESNVKPEGKNKFCKRIYAMGFERKEIKVPGGRGDRSSKYAFNKVSQLVVV